MVYAASNYLEAADLVGKEEALKDSTVGSPTVSLTKGNIRFTKVASNDGKLVILRFTETGGFTENTYKSLISVLEAIISDEYVSYFKGEYPNINTENKTFSHFKVTKTSNIFEVQVCVSEMEAPTTPSTTPNPTKTPTPSQTPDIENPSTGDMNTTLVLAIIATAVCGIGFSLKKINEN